MNEHGTAVHSPSGGAELLTAHGEYFDFEDFDSTAGLDIHSIAHSLATTNRFRGHTREPYSVAQHSVYVSLKCRPEDALWGLLHDAAEAFLGDVPSPAKRRLLPDFCREEAKIMERVCRHYGMESRMPASVHAADQAMCATEARDLMPEGEWLRWNIPQPPYRFTVYPVSWQQAESMFLDRYHVLMRLRGKTVRVNAADTEGGTHD